MSKKVSRQKLYKITLSKTFAYPSAVIDEGNFLRDLHQKAVSDLVNRIASGKFRESEFDVRLESESPFKIRSSKDIVHREDDDRTDLDFIVSELAEYDVEQKYGKLDPTKNPAIYVAEDPVYDYDEDTEEEVLVDDGGQYLKPEVENYLYERRVYYYTILKKKVL